MSFTAETEAQSERAPARAAPAQSGGGPADLRSTGLTPAAALGLQRSAGNRVARAVAAAQSAARIPSQRVQAGSSRRRLARIGYNDCSSDQQSTISDANDRALEMLREASDKLSAYDGTNPPEVASALRRNFNTDSTTVAGQIHFFLWQLRGLMRLATYKCKAEPNGSALAMSLWCLPMTDIRVYPSFFGTSRDDRAATLIHECMHHYHCRLDTGYEWESGYSGHSYLRQLLNADSFSTLVYDVTRPAATPATPTPATPTP